MAPLMLKPTGEPARLGPDNVIRFVDVDHFRQELSGNLRQGRAFVQTSRAFKVMERVRLDIEAPGVDWRVAADAVVVFARDGFVGLEFQNFEKTVSTELDRLGQQADQPRSTPGGEVTVVGPAPTFDGTATIDQSVTKDILDAKTIGTDVPRLPHQDTVSDQGTPVRVDGTQDIEMYARPSRRRRRRAAGVSEDFLGDETLDGFHPAATGPTTQPTQPAPLLPAEGLEVFEAGAWPFVRSTRDGTVTLDDEGDLLGLYLSQIRHGLLTLVGGPDGEIGGAIQLRIASKREIKLDGFIIARVGAWVTLAIEDPAPVETALYEQSEALRTVFAEVTGDIAVLSEATDPTAPSKPEAQPSPKPTKPQTTTPPPKRQESDKTRSSGQQPDQLAAPVLEGSIVQFSTADALVQELKANLKNGGLFVQSEPINLRTKMELSVQVGSVDTGLTASAEVVFADGGRVGFMVTNAGELCPALETFVETGQPVSAPKPASEPEETVDIRGEGRRPRPLQRAARFSFERRSNF